MYRYTSSNLETGDRKLKITAYSTARYLYKRLTVRLMSSCKHIDDPSPLSWTKAQADDTQTAHDMLHCFLLQHRHKALSLSVSRTKSFKYIFQYMNNRLVCK